MTLHWTPSKKKKNKKTKIAVEHISDTIGAIRRR